mmetsp:Transcript_19551/g.46678  ORF Transcript_19551/g.46678 Transcript_19551/m.46678 type:complete len:104 (-) Transcript_19551:31-342(-)
MRQRDDEIDRGLDAISRGVGVLKNMAVDMREEVQVQNMMVDEIQEQVEKNTERIGLLNAKLKKTLDSAGGASRIILNLILLILLLAIAAYCYDTFKGGGSHGI